MKKDGRKVRCPKCDYGWRTESGMMHITCPNCTLKVKPIEEEKE